MGRTFQKRLEELGGTCMYAYGEGDNSEDLEDDFEKWSKGFWPAAGKAMGMDSVVADPEDEAMPPVLRLQIRDASEEETGTHAGENGE